MAIDNRNLLEREIKAQERAEAEKERARESLAFVSHELRTPLTSIAGFASTLLAEDVTWSIEQQRDFIETIQDEANKLNGFIEQLLDISRMGAGVFNFSTSRQSVENLIIVALPAVQALARQHNLGIDIPNTLPNVVADPRRFEQVLATLVENVAKYATPGTIIRISARSNKNFVEFSVVDEGPGISREEKEKVFQAFYEVGDQIIFESQGAGLGLTICKKLVEGQGGCIWVAERSEPGTVISFTLPVADVPRKQSE